ncbi:MAG: ABC transporter substrate-binding protein [Dehalococcoidia bacterium]|jgi:branched-chain amino acid transport system substrate-binding protein
MKKLDKGLWMTALTLVVAITFLAGCAPSGGTTTSTAEQPGVVNIIMTVPLSGMLASFGQEQQEGMQMAVDEINAAGGVKVAGKNYLIKLTVMDDEFDASKGEDEVDMMLEKLTPKPVFYWCGSDVVGKVIMDENEKENLIMEIVSSDKAVVSTGNKLLIRLESDTRDVAKGFANITYDDMGCKKAIMLCGDDSASGLYRDQWIETYKSKGGQLLDSIDVDLFSTTDFYPFLTKAIAENPDVISTFASADSLVLMMTQAQQLGYKGKWVFGDVTEVGEVLHLIPAKAMQTMGTFCGVAAYETATLPEGQQTRFRAHIKKFHDKYGADKLWGSIVTNPYELCYAFKYAMEKTGTTTDAYAIRAAMADAVPVPEGVYPFYKINPDGSGEYCEFANICTNGVMGNSMVLYGDPSIAPKTSE